MVENWKVFRYILKFCERGVIVGGVGGFFMGLFGDYSLYGCRIWCERIGWLGYIDLYSSKMQC